MKTTRTHRIARAVLSLLALVLLAAPAKADPIPATTIGFHTAGGAVGNYYNGGTDAAGNTGTNSGIVFNTTNSASGGVLNGASNPTLSVPSGFTTGFSVNAINVAVGFVINVYDGENGTGTLLASQQYHLNGNVTGSVTFAGTAKSISLGKFSGSPSYDNLTFGSATVGTPVNEPPAVTTSAASNVTTGGTATLNATVNPGGAATTAQLEYGTTTGYGSTAGITLSPNNGTTAQTVSANLSGLAASTLYHFRVTGVNSVGSRNGSDLTFTTPAANNPPTVTAANPTLTVNEGTATSNALTVNDPEGGAVTVTASFGSIGVLASATYLSEFATTANPRRLAIDSAGNLYVGSASGVVTKYDANGNQLLQFTVSPAPTPAPDDFNGIDVGPDGSIYISHNNASTQLKYSSTGTSLGTFGPNPGTYMWGGRFGGPSGNFYRLDRHHRLVLLDASGVQQWATQGYNAGVQVPPNTGLWGPADVAIHPTTGASYVVDHYGSSGITKAFDASGATTGYFNNKGITIDMDAQGNLWMAEAAAVRKYTPAGIALGSFGTSGTGAGQFQSVNSIRFDAAGKLWVLDYTRNKLIKFDIGQSSYSWLHTPADGPAGPTTVTITATDSFGASGQTTFTLNVNNVAPTATFSRSAATVNENTVTPPNVSFTSQVDPGTTDVSTGLKYSYDFNNDGIWDDGVGTYAGSLTATTKTIPAGYFVSPAPSPLVVKGRILDKDGGLTDYTVSITINHAPTAINGPLTIVEDFDYGVSAGTLSGNGGAGFSTAWNGGSYTPTGLTFSSLTSPGGAWNGSAGSRNFAATLAAAGPITGDFLFSMGSAPGGRVQMFGLGGFNNQNFTLALAPANDSTPTGGIPIVGLNSGGFANITAGAVALNTTYLYRFAYAGSSITAWILTAAQYDNFAPGGLTDAELNAASIGSAATEVTGRVTKTGNVTGNMANLFTYTFGGSGVTMDRLRMTGTPVGASLIVAENAAINTSAGTLLASDQDAGNTFTFTLVSGAGDADNASFNLSGSTVRSSAVFNYEVKNSYSLRVRVTDQGGLSYETPLTVTIANVNEAVTDLALSQSSIAENNATNATVGTLTATDNDTGDTHSFTLVGGTGSADNGSFTIAGSVLRLTASANYEVKSSYALRVRATDQGGLFFEKPFIVTITDLPETPLELWRQANFGSYANTGNAADTASPDGDPYSNLLEFAFGTDPNNAASGPGSISHAAGVITLRAQPTVSLAQTPTGVDFRALFGRRKDWVASGLTYTVQFSADLTTWETSAAIPTVVASDAEIDAVTVPYPFFLNSGEKAQFFRVQVSIQ